MQSWSVHVQPSAITTFVANPPIINPGEWTTITAVFTGRGSIDELGGFIASGSPTITAPLPWSVTYHLTVTDNAGGEWRRALTVFTRPSVTNTDPSNGAVNIPIAGLITARFSDGSNVNPSTINSATFLLRDSTNNAVAGNITFANDVATFMPSQPLLPLTVYTAKITTGAASYAGISNLTDYVWTFTTAP